MTETSPSSEQALAKFDYANEGVGLFNVSVRERITDEFIDRSRDYWHLKTDVNVRTRTDQTPKDNWIDETPNGESEIVMLKPIAEAYFNYRITFFKFTRRADRTLKDLLPWRRPFTHADLEEEDIEQSFPDDIRKRALIKALSKIIRHNQIRHIKMKRWYQFGYTAAVAVVVLVWYLLGFLATNAAVGWVSGALNLPVLLSPWLSLAVWLIGLALLWGGSVYVARTMMEKFLRDTTSLFKDANKSSCDAAFRRLSDFNGNVRVRFTKYFLDIQQSQAKLEEVRKNGWLDRVRDAFKTAMWEAKRIESMEKFWQLEFERLRIFELLSDRAGNLSSVLLSVAITIGVAIIVVGSVIASANFIAALAVLVAATSVAWSFGGVSRADDLSFNMRDIMAVGFETDWKAFQTVGYYDQIADEFRKTKGDWRTEKLEQGR